MKTLRALLLGLLLALLVGIAIGTALRKRLERPSWYIGLAPTALPFEVADARAPVLHPR